mmetsp:Transcript_5541/g.4736  ORF Transcript_5541/g.4736 Transcript_5541/m.4736 type:complete len:100 (+) Transcript_5541:318-617(+)|eukprot:CAMPEP_0205805956 /NCGR_PEP_ID=MMETSP0205-20121125/9316_1 /ASSEMBLY_ACC=CAM_ASM_000278 /TAXON_ID=36767 /ORGANISM="Euplotes focardii, Strain TN1" /LENGTH=99 /DNA_ID=CAMNT_0053077965 /DNA_START=207 /DNA_END=506 /DNA_ORIENTATION=+
MNKANFEEIEFFKEENEILKETVKEMEEKYCGAEAQKQKEEMEARVQQAEEIRIQLEVQIKENEEKHQKDIEKMHRTKEIVERGNEIMEIVENVSVMFL